MTMAAHLIGTVIALVLLFDSHIKTTQCIICVRLKAYGAQLWIKEIAWQELSDFPDTDIKVQLKIKLICY